MKIKKKHFENTNNAIWWMCTRKRRKKNLSNNPRRERCTEIIHGFALDFWTAAHEARMSGRIPAPSAGYPVDTPPTPDAHVTISNKNSFFFMYTSYIFRCALCIHTYTQLSALRLRIYCRRDRIRFTKTENYI